MLNNNKFKTGQDLRAEVRAGRFSGQTAGQAPNFLQGNVVILPLRYAQDFMLYCANNPKPCPVIGVSGVGDPTLPDLGNIDIRTDIPRYRLFREGHLEGETTDIREFWRDDLVAFVLGCSFTFEEALIQNGYAVRHIEAGQNVPMFRTNIETMPGGIFSGPLVVTMRSYPESQIPDIYELSAQYPHAHGTPIYWGDPEVIGISDLMKPDYGDPMGVPEGEVPVFWACGVTPQAAIDSAKPDFCMTHAPGCMLVTDVPSMQAPKVNLSISQFWQTDQQMHQLGE
ncbi:putative hydro-lyase [Roseibium sediminis]|uniref:putative hydro-lyase n=1 Tax=Roseibium sediminis TaxID=1775174 RepID=UPI00123E3BFF|nr:putative hydro-lyase [Roseibium sediminis]